MTETTSPAPVVTPARLRELAAASRQLAADIRAAEQTFDGAPDVTRHARFRLPEAAGNARFVAEELEATATDLDVVLGWQANPHRCPVEWGACPDHGATLTSSGGHTWCSTLGCGRRWDYDRHGQPCDEPPLYTVRDQTDAVSRVCRGHARAMKAQLVGAVVTPDPWKE